MKNSNKKIITKTLNLDKLFITFNTLNYNVNIFLNVTQSKIYRLNNNHLL